MVKVGCRILQICNKAKLLLTGDVANLLYGQ